MSRLSLSIIIAAYNEELNLSRAIETALAAASASRLDCEIIVVDDASIDATASVAASFANQHEIVSYVRHDRNKGFGAAFQTGMDLASKEYLLILPGDNEISEHSVKSIVSMTGTADMVLPYTVNTELRTPGRRFLSRTYSILCNTLFGSNIQYFNGPVLHSMKLLREIKLNTSSFAFQTEAILQLLALGRSYIEIPLYLQEKAEYRSSALKLKNVFLTLNVVLRLFFSLVFSGDRAKVVNNRNRIPIKPELLHQNGANREYETKGWVFKKGLNPDGTKTFIQHVDNFVKSKKVPALRQNGQVLSNNEMPDGIYDTTGSGLLNFHLEKNGIMADIAKSLGEDILCDKLADFLVEVFATPNFVLHQSLIFFWSPVTDPHPDMVTLGSDDENECFTIWMALDDVSDLNGGIYVTDLRRVDTSDVSKDDYAHFADTYEERFYDAQPILISPVMRPGDFVLFSSTTPHGSFTPKKPWKTKKRWGIQLVFRTERCDVWGGLNGIGKQPHEDADKCQFTINKNFKYYAY